MRVLLTLAAVAALLISAAPAPAATFRSCKQVNFTPNSDDLAASIRVRGVTCRYARRFVRQTEGSPSETELVRGWRCRGRTVDEFAGLTYTNWRCTRGERTMRWKRY